jgi:hypothetical protein
LELKPSRSHATNSAPVLSLVDVIERSPMTPEKPGRLEWWYRLNAPPEPPPSANLKQREAHRRGRLIATILLVQICIDVLVVLTVGVFVNHFVILNTGLFIPILLVAGWLNRRGRVIVSGVMTVGFVALSLFALIATYPGGVSIFALPFFDLLVFVELFAVSLLPEGTVFIAAIFNVAFIIASIFLLSNQEMKALLQTPQAVDAIVRPVSLQIGVAFVCYLWVRSAKKALERADRATTIATLEHTLAQQGLQADQQRQQLEESIQQIVDTHLRVANGDYAARVPMTQDSSLWEVAGLLNNALARLQHLQRNESELRQVQQAVNYLGEALRRSNGRPVPWPQTGTVFDVIVLQYNALAQQHALLAQRYDKLAHAYAERQPKP